MQKKCILLSDTEVNVRSKPVNLIEKDSDLFASEYLRIIGPSFLEETFDVYLLGDRILTLDQEKKQTKLKVLLVASNDSVDNGLKARIHSTIRRFSALLKSVSKLDTGVWVIDKWSHGYFHWMTECLMKISCLQKRIHDIEVLLPSNHQKLKFVCESLDYFQIPYQFLPANKLIKVSKLSTALFTFSSGNYNFQLIKDFVNRNRNSSAIQPEVSRRIWISRSSASKRSIKNEAQLYPILLNYGFEIIKLEDYTFTEQVEMMRSTEILAGLHGAGLTNMLFMPLGGKVIEVRRQNDDHNNCYFALASDVRIKYYYMLATPLDNDLHNGDCRLEPSVLEEFLQTYINPSE